jgi:hypothetical protein
MAAGDVIPGVRRDCARHESQPGEYGKTRLDGREVWWCHPPGTTEKARYRAGMLTNHDVVEHDDGTITVSPSILIHAGSDDPGWHGYLERGVWREV